MLSKAITFIISIVAFFSPMPADAQLKAFRNTVADSYNFWLYHPDKGGDTVIRRLPVLIFLHGRSLSGSNMDKVRRYGIIDALEKGRRVDAIVVAPQCPAGSGWSADRLSRLLDWIQETYDTDTNRVYVAGMSLGGYGTLDFAGTYPNRVAAAVALCGGGTPSMACSLGQVPLWIMHGTHDRHVPISESEKMVKAISDCGDTSRLRFTRLKGLDHGDLARVFYTQNLYDWLFLHSRNDTSMIVDRNVMITPEDLRTVYSDLNTRGGAIKVDRGGSNPSQAESNTGYDHYIIKKGDTLSSIARRHHTSVKKLCDLNGITETTILQIGRKLRVR